MRWCGCFLILLLAVALPAAAADHWKVARLADGTLCSEGPAVQVYPDDAVLVDGVILLDGEHLEAKGNVVELIRLTSEGLPSPHHFVVPVDHVVDVDGKIKAVRKPKISP